MPLNFNRSSIAIAVLAAVMFALFPAAVSAKPFKWAGRTDIQSMDIHSQNSALGNGIHAAV